jgi:hypothetical protein
MSTGAIVVIVVVAVIVIAVAVASTMMSRRRRLREKFGPEYDRAVRSQDSRMKAESELAGRERRVRELDIRPLSAESRERYARQWVVLQERFVDAPQIAVTDADTLVTQVMLERGYPAENYDQMVADLSVQHAGTMDNARAAHAISERASAGEASTEDLRQAMIHYRELFGDLLGTVRQPGHGSLTADQQEAGSDRAPGAQPQPGRHAGRDADAADAYGPGPDAGPGAQPRGGTAQAEDDLAADPADARTQSRWR